LSLKVYKSVMSAALPVDGASTWSAATKIKPEIAISEDLIPFCFHLL
jgi:hypothetical protein